MSTSISELLKERGLSAFEAAFLENGFIDEKNRVTIQEAFASPDAPILFPKVISRTLKEAAEPVNLVTPLLSTVRTNARSMEFPAVNALQAAEVPEGQEFPEQALVFAKQVEGKTSKKGVRLSFTDEVMKDSQWDIVGLHVRAAGRAMARLKEQIALSRFSDAATIIFDNDDAGYRDTTGRSINGAANDTFAWQDTLVMAAALHAENHYPTDFIAHSLFWPAFLQGSQFHVAGMPPAAINVGLQSKEGVANATAPFGLNVILSPYVSYTAGSVDGTTPAKSDVFLIDRTDVGVLMVREDLSTDEWMDQTRDIKSMKVKERYDIVCFGDGEGITVAKNVSLAANYDVSVTRSLTSDI
jgi:hypothetical protein